MFLKVEKLALKFPPIKLSLILVIAQCCTVRISVDIYTGKIAVIIC